MSRSRPLSLLKDLIEYMRIDGMISLFGVFLLDINRYLFLVLTMESTGAGNAQLISLARQLTDRVHKPLYLYNI
ncbi:hypothetical protein SEUCBS139899_008661 [Sporothrix eucalyptigena]